MTVSTSLLNEEQSAVIADAHIQTLQAAFLSLLIAHRTPCGCKPTEQQHSEISALSGAAVAAIFTALGVTAAIDEESQH